MATGENSSAPEDIDSRNLLLGKRSMQQISTDGAADLGVDSSMALKRARYDNDVKDATIEAHSKTLPAPFENEVPKEVAGVASLLFSNLQSEDLVAHSPTQIPSLQDVFSLRKIPKNTKLPVKENKTYVKRFEKYWGAFHKAKQDLEMTKATSTDVKSKEVAFYKAQVNLAWCQYYPIRASWHAPASMQVVGFTTAKSQMRIARERFWLLVEKCIQDDTLLELRAGSFGTFEDVRDVVSKEALPQGDDHPIVASDPESMRLKDLRKASQRYERHVDSTKARSAPNHGKGLLDFAAKKHASHVRRAHLAEVDINYCNYYPTDRSYVPLDQFRARGPGVKQLEPSATGSSPQFWKFVEVCMQTNELHKLGVARPSINETPQAQSKPHDGLQDAAEGARNRAPGSENSYSSQENVESSDEDDGGVPIPSDQDRVQAQSELPLRGDRTVTGPAQQQTEVSSPMEDGQVHSESQSPNRDRATSQQMDAMHLYADTEQGHASSGRSFGSEQHRDAPKPGSGACLLEDLTSKDLDAQLRYFHVFKTAEQVSEDIPVQCLTCRQQGHMAAECKALVCSQCGAFNMHPSSNCNAIKKCSKCKERGHDLESCPHKLKKLMQHEMICGLCNHIGHDDGECELVWRTSGLPVDSDIPTKNVNLSCYECGKSGHLGNDCSSRRPGKARGTSTWTLKKETIVPGFGPAPAELNIRGRAQQRTTKPVVIENDSERGNFYRPKQQKPSGQGQIRINNAVANSETVKPSQPKQNPGGRAPPKERYQVKSGSTYGGRASSGADNNHNYSQPMTRPPQEYDYTPQYTHQQNSYNTTAYSQPSPRMGNYAVHQQPAQPYLPMPSAAHTAWSDYCDVYLTHDSMSVRKAHNSGRNHERNVLEYYQQIGHEKAQSVIDSITNSYNAEGQGASNPMLGPAGGPPPPMPGQGFPPPQFFPGGMPPPPFNMPGGPQGGPPPGFPPPGGRGMPPFPPFPPAGSPSGQMPNMPGMPPNMPFPPPGGMPFQPPGQGQGPGQAMSPPPGQGTPGGHGGPYGPPGGGPPGGSFQQGGR